MNSFGLEKLSKINESNPALPCLPLNQAPTTTYSVWFLMETIKITRVLRMCRTSSCALRELDPPVRNGGGFVQFLLPKHSPSRGWWSGWRSWWFGDTHWAQPQPEEGPADWDSCVQCRKWYWEWNCRAVTWLNLQWGLKDWTPHFRVLLLLRLALVSR